MPREYLDILNFSDMQKFIKITLSKRFNTELAIKLKNVKTSSQAHDYEFDIVGSNGLYAQGLASFTEFGCLMQVAKGKVKHINNYDKEWAHFVYNSLKERDKLGFSEYKYSAVYKDDYNAHLQQRRDEKVKFAQTECEQNMIK